MFPLDVLGVPLAWAVEVRVQRPRGGAPMIGRKPRETTGLEPRFPLQADLILATPNTIRQHGTCVVIAGMPQPALSFLLADNTPPRIPLRFTSARKVPADVVRMQGASQGLVDGLQHRCLLCERTEDGGRTARQHARRIAHPAGVQAQVQCCGVSPRAHTRACGNQAEHSLGNTRGSGTRNAGYPSVLFPV